MKRTSLFLIVLAFIFCGCAKQNNSIQEAESELEVEAANLKAPSIALPETHLDVFGVSMGLEIDSFISELSTIFHDTIETKRKWGSSSMDSQKVININNLPFACQIDTISGRVAKVTFTSPIIDVVYEYDPIGADAIYQVLDSLIVWEGGKVREHNHLLHQHYYEDFPHENGWIKITLTGCCAIAHCTIEFVDRENMLLYLLQTPEATEISEDSCILGHYYAYNENRVLDAKHGFFPFHTDSDLIVVPQYRGSKYLEKQFGKGSFYRARVKNSQYPYLDFPKDEVVEYDEEKDENYLHRTDSSSVVVRAWQLPDSAGYLYYVAHQDNFADMLPLWTTLIYSPTSLSRKFIHKNYRVEYFWPSDKRY